MSKTKNQKTRKLPVAAEPHSRRELIGNELDDLMDSVDALNAFHWFLGCAGEQEEEYLRLQALLTPHVDALSRISKALYEKPGGRFPQKTEPAGGQA